MTKLVGAFQRLRLRTKLLIAFNLLVVFAIGLFSLLITNRINEYGRAQTRYTASQTYEQTYSYLSYKIDIVDTVAKLAATDSSLVRILSASSFPSDIYDQIEDFRYIKSYLLSLKENYSVARVQLYVQNRSSFLDGNANLLSLDDLAGTPWLTRADEDDALTLWYPNAYFGQTTDTPYISLARRIRNPNLYSQAIGVVKVDLYESEIRSILDKTITSDDNACYIINERDELITCSSNSTAVVDKLMTAEIDFGLEADGVILPIGGQDYILHSRHILNTDWRMVYAIPLNALQPPGISMLNSLAFYIALIFVTTYILSYALSHSITRRISLLSEKMKSAQAGTLTLMENKNPRDDVGELIENYNYTIETLELLIKQQFEYGKIIKASELKVLQAQINPHFLYNVLDLVHWLAIKHKTEDIDKVVTSLAKYYRISLSRGEATIPLEEELQHVEFYVQIQNVRFSNGIRLHINVPEEMMRCLIPKITLQPIVENSILHGILRKQDKTGSIAITGRFEAEDIVLGIMDDGIGIEKEDLDRITLGQVKSQTGSSFGIKNTNDRIKMLYGGQYGITYSSKPGQYTLVELRIPRVSP